MVGKNIEEQIRLSLLAGRLSPGNGTRTDRIYKTVQNTFGFGTVYHVLSDTPDQSCDVFRVLVDDKLVVGFELDREDLRAGPEEIVNYTIPEYMNAVGGRAKIELRIAVELAQNELRGKLG